MSLRYALLGYLYDTSMSGYDLAKVFDFSVGFFWSASHSQIYPELIKMEEEGLLTSRKVAQEDRPSKTLYKAAAKGREEFIRWMRKPTRLDPPRNTFLIKTFFMNRLDPREAIELIDGQLRLLRKRLDAYRNMKKTGQGALACMGKPLDFETKLLTLDYGIVHTEASIKWCEKAIKTLRSHIDSSPVPRRGISDA